MPLPRLGALAAITLTGLFLAAAPAQAATRSCDIRKEAGKFGPTYVTQLKVTNTSCAAGKDVVRAFHRCRKASGGIKGRCRKPVLGYSCSERRSSIPTQITGVVTCKKGTRRVNHSYSQNT